MASMTLDPRFQWKRSSAISVTLALHALALLAILAPPAFVPLEKPAATPVLTVSVKKEEPPPPPPPELKIEDKPKPQVRPQAVKLPPQPEKVVPLITEQITPMSTPADDVTVAPGPVEAAPVETRPSALGYRSTREVRYPPDSAKRREEGTVMLRVLVGPDGVPQEVDVERSSGFVSLDRAAKAAVMKWRFEPGTRNGQPIAAYGLVPIAFKLTEL